MSSAPRDENRAIAVQGTSTLDGSAVTIYADPTTHRLYVDSFTSGMELPAYDYVAMVIDPAETETYTFKTGGASGTTVATVVIVYTDATRADISTVTKT